jgi:hypothetical protein
MHVGAEASPALWSAQSPASFVSLFLAFILSTQFCG